MSRYEEYLNLDERSYIFTYQQYKKYIENDDFDISECLVDNVLDTFKKDDVEEKMELPNKRTEYTGTISSYIKQYQEQFIVNRPYDDILNEDSDNEDEEGGDYIERAS